MSWERIGLLIRLNAIFICLPMVIELPLWIGGIWAFAAGLDIFFFRFTREKIPGRLPAILVLGASFLIVRHYKALFGQEPSGALLAILLALKLMEGREYREYMIAVFLTYYIVMSKLLFSQTLVATLYMVGGVASTTLMLYLLHAPYRPGRSDLIPALRQTGKTFFLGVPILVLLFFVFPRFSSPLVRWVNQPKPKTGFSDSLNPGDLGQLANSQEMAFRVQFSDKIRLRTDQLYWRGAVLTKGKGLIWSRSLEEPATTQELATVSEMRNNRALIDYEINLEPQFSTWLFALDVPVDLLMSQSFPFRIIKKVGHTFALQDPAISRLQYQGTSFLGKKYDSELKEGGEPGLRPYLVVPSEVNERVQALAEKLGAGRTRDEEKVEAILDYFRVRGFMYTLTPGALRSENQLEQFLFDTRKGFCEHFAAAFASLARAMKIPSRVVTGFQGGEYNAYGGYYLIRERDAHAWAEVYLKQRGWTRYDPTEVVAPERIQRGGQYLASEFGVGILDADIGTQILEAARITQPGLGKALDFVTMNWDAMTYRWHSFLLGYDSEYQKQILRSLGLDQFGTGFLFLTVVLGTITLGMALARILKLSTLQRDLNLELLESLYKKLALRGLVRGPSEGHLAFMRRAQEQLGSEIGADFEQIHRQLIEERYAKRTYSKSERGHFFEMRERIQKVPALSNPSNRVAS